MQVCYPTGEIVLLEISNTVDSVGIRGLFVILMYCQFLFVFYAMQLGVMF